MIKSIEIKKYRKLQNITIDFASGINIISGTNATCKTSLLHIISNSFQAVTKKTAWIKDADCPSIIGRVNYMTNPKIETLTKGDKEYNDPAFGYKGAIYCVEYNNGLKLNFRRHNPKIENRYSVKPMYKVSEHESLPVLPVIYLGLQRLVPFGEYQIDEDVKTVKKSLPEIYMAEIRDLYDELSHMKIKIVANQKVGKVKMRADFTTETEGVDSNTISAGEDNLYIILNALVSLKFYYQSIVSYNTVESILLIDEFDATLHPSLQVRLLEKIREYAEKYKIQVIFTTHSLSLLEYALTKQYNVIYLLDNLNDVSVMDDIDIYKVKMHLKTMSQQDIYTGKKVPIFTEDSEARVFLNCIFDYFSVKHIDFGKVRQYFHIIDISMGAKDLIGLFSDDYLLKSCMQCIGILDGDQQSNKNNHLITLPGSASPEKLIMKYSLDVYNNDDRTFWNDEYIMNCGFTKMYFVENIKDEIENIDTKLEETRANGQSTHGLERKLRKEVFLQHRGFFIQMFKHWINNNNIEIEKFYEDLKQMFKKTSRLHGLNPKMWN